MYENNDPEPTLHIGSVLGWIMIGVSAMIDLVRIIFALLIFIPILGEIGEGIADFIGMFAELCFALWFIILGVRFFGKKSWKRLTTFLGASVADLIPFANFLPVNTFAVWYTIRSTQKEDRDEHRMWEEREKKRREEEALQLAAAYTVAQAASDRTSDETEEGYPPPAAINPERPATDDDLISNEEEPLSAAA